MIRVASFNVKNLNMGKDEESLKVLLTAPFVRKHSVSAVRKLSVCMPTPFPEST